MTGKTHDVDIDAYLRSYIHLNASFSDNIGILNGKSAAALYFGCLDDEYYRSEVTFAFLEEILFQIDSSTPLSFGNGVAGVGSLLLFLDRNGIIDIDVGDVLEDVEPHLVKFAKMGMYDDVSLCNGLSGVGTYLLRRYWNEGLEQGKKIQIKEALDCVVERLLSTLESPSMAWSDLSLWTGFPGIYLFLTRVLNSGTCIEILGQRLELVGCKILELLSRDFNWQQLPIWYSLLSGKRGDINPVVNREMDSIFQKYLNWCSDNTNAVNFYDAAFYASLYTGISNTQGLANCRLIADRLASSVVREIQKSGVSHLFPYRPESRDVGMGINRGVCSTALGLQSVRNCDARWLEIFG